MTRRGNTGLSLVEAVLALGLLTGVLVSASGLFVVGMRQVRAGGSASQALAVGVSILEEMEGWGFRQVYAAFGRDGSATRYALDSRSEARAAGWQQMLDEARLDGHAEIEIASVGADGPASALRSTRAIRVTVTVHWRVGRRRRLSLVAVRM